MRLFGEDPLTVRRANSGFRGEDETQWQRWGEEDRAALKKPTDIGFDRCGIKT
jgi:hypothetical protein